MSYLHGTYTAYARRGCRCDHCTKYQRTRVKRNRLDPFSGSGTTGMAAAKHGRRYVGIDLNANYLDLSLRTRLQQPGLDLEGIA